MIKKLKKILLKKEELNLSDKSMNKILMDIYKYVGRCELIKSEYISYFVDLASEILCFENKDWKGFVDKYDEFLIHADLAEDEFGTDLTINKLLNFERDGATGEDILNCMYEKDFTYLEMEDLVILW